jgi:acyl carrier protein phosphodiesterase
MNYLAHIYLARQSGPAMVGAMLGDFVKVNDGEHFSPEIAREISLHRYVDSYTDAHPIVIAAKQLFPEGRRRYAGIVLDVFYDHVLSQRWDAYCATSKQALIERFYQALADHEDVLPEKLQEILPRLIKQDWLGAYGEFSGVELAISRISTRLSRNGHLLREGISDVLQHYEAIASGFDQFFPDLIAFADERRQALSERLTS